MVPGMLTNLGQLREEVWEEKCLSIVLLRQRPVCRGSDTIYTDVV